jgi:hypothetical protein
MTSAEFAVNDIKSGMFSDPLSAEGDESKQRPPQGHGRTPKISRFSLRPIPVAKRVHVSGLGDQHGIIQSALIIRITRHLLSSEIRAHRREV